MKVLHLISGGETGGSKNHLLSLLQEFNHKEILLGVFQEGQLAKEAKEMGLPVIVFGQTSRYDFSILRRIKDAIREEKVDIVHTHGPRANLYAYLLRARIKFMWVTTIHSDPTKDFIKGGLKGKVFTAINMKVIRKIDHFFAVSERFKEMLVGFGVDKGKITTIYNGISFDEKRNVSLTRADLQLKKDLFVIIMVARLHPIKGHEVVFAALSEIINLHPEVQLLLVGDGPIREELEEQVQTLHLQQHVRFVGFQSDVDSYLRLADVKLLASYSESFPLVLLEAARAEIPVISTDVGGVRELIPDESFGWVIPPKDKQALIEVVHSAVERKHSGELALMGKRLHEKAKQDFSINQLVETTKKTYWKIYKGFTIT